jgi:FixJ family two-component response regulator
VDYIPRRAAIIAHNQSEADFAESTISSYGVQVSRYDSTRSLTERLQSLAGMNGDGHKSIPNIAILVGSTSDFATDVPTEVGELAELMPVMVTTSATSVSDAVELMKHGAKDVVELPCDRDSFWHRVSSAMEAANAEAAIKATQAEMKARLALLTPAENAVVDAMLDGLANKQIAQRLGIGLRTVELRRSKIMRKMQARSVAELVKFICLSGMLRSQLVASEA